MSDIMAKRKTKKQIEEEAFEELRRKALEPFKPTLTKKEQLEHEEEIRERSMRNYHALKKDIRASEKEFIKSRACFESGF